MGTLVAQVLMQVQVQVQVQVPEREREGQRMEDLLHRVLATRRKR